MKNNQKKPDRRTGITGGLPPAGNKKPVLVILGSYPSRQSLLKGEYYGNPRNQFWQIIQEILDIPAVLPYRQRITCLAGCGILLWDVLSSCSRINSSDATIQDPIPNNIRELLAENPSIRCIALNGQTGSGYYFRRFFPDIMNAGYPHLLILPSTSPANARMRLDEKGNQWKEILPFLSSKPMEDIT
ncbi:MAG: DNA-deoxyinosine glycosylase [Methanospirillaceae archaeon]|nr:DNA-deoxyinosine glycosylase [Methanospirillaceae archaeon]